MTLPASYFDDLYATTIDPWGFTSRWYEQRKYALTLAALPHLRYRRAFEPGCSIGVLTTQLAERCDALVASDPSPAALAAAKARVPSHVELRLGAVPDDWPDGTFDLIVCSEVGYYLSSDDLDRLLERIVTALEPEGNLIAVHWRADVADYPGRGDGVHARMRARLGSLAHYEDEFVLIDVLGGPAATLDPPE